MAKHEAWHQNWPKSGGHIQNEHVPEIILSDFRNIALKTIVIRI